MAYHQAMRLEPERPEGYIALGRLWLEQQKPEFTTAQTNLQLVEQQRRKGS